MIVVANGTPERQSVRVGPVLVILTIVWLIVCLGVRFGPAIRNGRKVVLDRPRPCSMRDAQQALDRLIGAGFDAEIVGANDNGMNMLANARVAGDAKPEERYVVRVPRKQAKAANRV